MRTKILRWLLPVLLLGAVVAASVTVPRADESGRRLEVLFFGAPTANHAAHDPITRYRILKKGLGLEGINLTYQENPAEVFQADNLKHFDAVLMYGNWDKDGAMPAAQLKALIDYVEGGGGFLPIHCASACYGASPEFVKLVGAKFKEHGGEEFKVKNVAPNHPILKGLEGFKAWDETYVHSDHADDREILQKRQNEPWSWTRTQGQGRVFYTASGHDHRVWDLPEFHALLRNAIYWSVGPEKYRQMLQLKVPKPGDEKVSLPGYREREEITVAQSPLPPQESIKLAQVPVGMEISLFASDPDIVNPIFVSWDARGRAYVIETIDYPNNLQAGNLGHDRITICEDTNGDGKADRFVRFAEKLSIPTSLVFVNGGVLCTNGTQVLFLKDTNGDDKADVREVVLDGFHMGDTHAGVSNLRYGFDGWLYATVGYSGFKGTVGGEAFDFGQAVFRFLPDGSKMEFLQNTTNNTWGLGFTEEFDVLGSTANANPSWYVSFPRADYEGAGLGQDRTPRADDNPLFNPMSFDIRQVDQFDRYTAGAGHAVYTARRFPESYWDKVAFVCGPTGKLIGHFDLRKTGAGWKAEQSPNNLFASADAWSSPVCAEVGPDGAVWVCDWYNLIIQHNPTPSRDSAGINAKTGKGNAYQTPLRDKQHGRIYRIYPRGSQDDVNPGLEEGKPETWFAAMEHPNLLWRLHAQRLIAESGKSDAFVAELVRVAQTSAIAAPHALYLLGQWGAVPDDLAEALMKSPHAAARRAAIAVGSPAALKAVFGSEEVSLEGRELAEMWIAMSRSAADPELGGALFAQAVARPGLFADSILADAWRIASRRQRAGVLAAAEEKPAQDGALQVQIELLKKAGGASPKQEVKRMFKPDAAIHERGKVVFSQTCIACHGLDGKGVPGAFPPIDGSDWLTGEAELPIRIVLHGLQGPLKVSGQEYNSVMAPLGGSLNDQQIADVLTYVRQSWGNDAAPVTVDEVSKVRAATADRTLPWTAGELGH
ncbi:putative membrane-bound dehydrogenase-like protein [Haloferula luteola]|uniref:Putative membrane-bound dehydrogenase-like protein n=1 Tax=Haloferula luteola TaxID=595692 RepID=A0A840VCE6_9BACT|nr:PVC-type heme-binding CxxCH protein [Haloferula luteola]MBB5352328.1 putative membrane-bound dehydrogenase-like protein [Haloferula luteola]